METAASTTTVSLKLLIDTKGQRVLYAEASKDFVDFLFSILLLPIGTVIRLLAKQGMVGSIGNLYKSVENLGDAYILPKVSKDTLLKPKSSIFGTNNVPLLLPNIQSSSTTQTLYHCSFVSYGGSYRDCRSYYTNDPTTICPSCSSVMRSPAKFVNSDSQNKVLTSSSAAANEGGYVKGVVMYTITDNLTVMPMSTISSIAMLNKFNVKHIDALKEKVVDVGMNEGMQLLKASLESNTVLTDVFLTPKATKKRCK